MVFTRMHFHMNGEMRGMVTALSRSLWATCRRELTYSPSNAPNNPARGVSSHPHSTEELRQVQRWWGAFARGAQRGCGVSLQAWIVAPPK